MGKWVRSGVLAGAPDLVAQLGGDFASLAARAGLKADILDDPDRPIEAATVPLLLDIAAERLRCPSFGLRLGQRQDLSLFGPLGLSIRDAESIRDLVRNLVDLFPLHTQGAIVGLIREDGETLLTYELSADIYPSHRHVVELGFSMFAGEIRRHSPGWQSPHMAFRHAPPVDTRWHHRLLGPNLIFNADRNTIVLDAALMAHPIRPAPAADIGRPGPGRHEFAAFHAERLIRASLPGRLLAIADAARLMRLSKRSLQRRLAALGTSFETIVDSVRSDLALAYLRDSDLSVAQIAETLQFSETSALSRAVRRWHDACPRELRQRAADARTAPASAGGFVFRA